MSTVNIIVAGVADQPVYQVAQRLAAKAGERGFATATSGSPEARAGKGITAVARWGSGALSPLVAKGTCTAVIGLEALEGLRLAAGQFAAGLTLLLSTRESAPTSVLHKGKAYPDVAAAIGQLEAAGVKVIVADAAGRTDEEIAEELAERALALFL